MPSPVHATFTGPDLRTARDKAHRWVLKVNPDNKRRVDSITEVTIHVTVGGTE